MVRSKRLVRSYVSERLGSPESRARLQALRDDRRISSSQARYDSLFGISNSSEAPIASQAGDTYAARLQLIEWYLSSANPTPLTDEFRAQMVSRLDSSFVVNSRAEDPVVRRESIADECLQAILCEQERSPVPYGLRLLHPSITSDPNESWWSKHWQTFGIPGALTVIASLVEIYSFYFPDSLPFL